MKSLKIRKYLDDFGYRLQVFYRDICDWLDFLYRYSRKRLIVAIVHFEKGKDSLVDVLLVKRGRYGKHFLNISFLFIVAGAVVGGPVIAEYYPTVPQETYSTEEGLPEVLSSLSQNDLTTTTVVSDKPRFDIIDYEVAKGDTLGSIAEKFGISIDTIKWANSLKTEKLIPGQMLRIPPVTGIVYKVKAGDILAESNFCTDGSINIGKNLLTCVMVYYGYNYEDGIVISDRVQKEGIFTSVHFEDLSFDIPLNKVLLTLN